MGSHRRERGGGSCLKEELDVSIVASRHALICAVTQALRFTPPARDLSARARCGFMRRSPREVGFIELERSGELFVRM